MLTTLGKMMFGICKMCALKDYHNPFERIVEPSDFTKHLKLNVRRPTFNSAYDIS